MRTAFLAGAAERGQGVIVLNKKRRDLEQMKPRLFYNKGGKTLAQIAQICGSCPIPKNIPGQVGQPDLVNDVPAHFKAIELSDL